ncbi:cell filamentation protein Fic [Rothia nasimurium]|uniref:cell filamentation protein Fic n=1 Tax=Rothia nasimurium TaxID=85336 RepID=UPI001627EE50|nr:cell filamentation protein Fic [Rothia nasimurium]
MVEAMRETTVQTLAKIKQIQALQERSVVVVLFEQPYYRIKDVGNRYVVTRQTATKYLGELVSVGVLREEKVGREKLFVNEELMEILRKG